MRILFVLIACMLLLAADKKQSLQRKIIDVHFHARLYADYPDPPPANPKTGKVPQWKNDIEIRDMMLSTLKNNNVVKVIVSGNISTVENWQMADPSRVLRGFDYPYEGNPMLPDTTSFVQYINEKRSMFLRSWLFSIME